MPLGIIGKKVGMTRIFVEDGSTVPVTVLQVDANRVSQVKDTETDGYRAIQVAYGQRKASRTTKPRAGQFKKAGIEAAEGVLEFRLDDDEEAAFEVGQELKADLLSEGQRVNASGVSKGKGFAGTIKRHNFRGQDNTHGNSVSHRAPGSTGMCQTPGRVFKGKKMSGQMGNEKVTTRNVKIVKVDLERDLILVKGPVPGAKGGRIVLRPNGTQPAAAAE